ncbi:MAG: CtsR family transcriptional regulator [Ruminococcaceae bacterium]|nr:CtsR family transcriptional regulator [Oscillospiraceae bacterium]
MLMSDIIANMIEEMIRENEGILELKRNDLAGKIGCVPSQINYVITSRFTPEKGYMIESRRGGGGYVRITKIQMSKDEYLMHFFHAIGESLDIQSAYAFTSSLKSNSAITQREENIIRSALKYAVNDIHRADMMKHIILAILKQEV